MRSTVVSVSCHRTGRSCLQARSFKHRAEVDKGPFRAGHRNALPRSDFVGHEPGAPVHPEVGRSDVTGRRHLYRCAPESRERIRAGSGAVR